MAGQLEHERNKIKNKRQNENRKVSDVGNFKQISLLIGRTCRALYTLIMFTLSKHKISEIELNDKSVVNQQRTLTLPDSW